MLTNELTRKQNFAISVEDQNTLDEKVAELKILKINWFSFLIFRHLSQKISLISHFLYKKNQQ